MAVDSSRALEPFKDIRELTESYPAERFHLLMPTTYVGRSPLFIPVPAIVHVNPNDERAVYKTPGGRDDDVSFHATTLQQIANAGGIDFDPTLTQHRHDRSKEPLLCEQIAAGWYIDSLGQRRLVPSGWTTHDLRDGSPRAKLLGGGKALDVARQFICEQCATRAMSRVIRKAMGLRGSYKKNELVYQDQVDGKSVTRFRGFVALRFRLDESDPDVKRALIQRGVGIAAEVFRGDTRELEAAAGGSAGHDETEDVLEGHVTEVAEPDIPDEPTEAPTAKKSDIRESIARLEGAAKASKADDRAAIGDPDGRVAYCLRDSLALKKWTKQDLSLVRRKMVATIFGINAADLTAAKIAGIVAASKDPQGQQDLGLIFDHLADLDDGIKAIKAAQV